MHLDAHRKGLPAAVRVSRPALRQGSAAAGGRAKEDASAERGVKHQVAGLPYRPGAQGDGNGLVREVGASGLFKGIGEHK